MHDVRPVAERSQLVSGATGAVTISASANVFSSSSVGQVLRAGGGIVDITTFDLRIHSRNASLILIHRSAGDSNREGADMNGKLRGVRLLVVEDEFLTAMELKRMIEDLGGHVVGPVARLSDARKLIASEQLDGAILDVNLDGNTTLALASDLMGRDIPVVFTTGYETYMLPDEFAKTPRLSKPYNDFSLRAFMEHHFKPAG